MTVIRISGLVGWNNKPGESTTTSVPGVVPSAGALAALEWRVSIQTTGRRPETAS
jgi:hypothetical protein